MKFFAGIRAFAAVLFIFPWHAIFAAEVAPANSAGLKVAAIFGDNMVLQQQMPAPIWGWAAPNADVTVKFAGQAKSARADADGKWLVKLDELKASFEPQTMTIQAAETKRVNLRTETGGNAPNRMKDFQTETFTNVLVGEVWLASGQSNMEKPIGKQPGQKPCFNADEELAAANYPNIRLFKVDKELAATPLPELRKFSGWRECDSNSLDGIKFSAAAYFFGREIYTNLNVPVGLIESSWGGTRIEPWTPPNGFDKFPSQKKFAQEKFSASGKISNTHPMAIFNAMIAPIAGVAIRGALWYQGESNLMGTNKDNDYLDYETKMEALVSGWRELWQEGDFPFYFVQIAPFNYSTWKYHPMDNSPQMEAEFWDLQEQAAEKIKNAGMIVTDDLVDNLNDIHPRDKQDVGHRLALLARNKTYGEKNVICSGPTFSKIKIDGDKAVLEFNHVDGGLVCKGDKLTWFAIAGADGKFVSADARIAGDTVEVSSPEVKDPKAVRFAWDETAQPNLYNGAGLPAEPFRTDGAR